MNGYEFFAKIIDALCWPVLTAFIFWVLRGEVINFIAKITSIIVKHKDKSFEIKTKDLQDNFAKSVRDKSKSFYSKLDKDLLTAGIEDNEQRAKILKNIFSTTFTTVTDLTANTLATSGAPLDPSWKTQTSEALKVFESQGGYTPEWGEPYTPDKRQDD